MGVTKDPVGFLFGVRQDVGRDLFEVEDHNRKREVGFGAGILFASSVRELGGV
jgi:hypothetical protein